MKRWRTALVALLLLSLWGTARADDWDAPRADYYTVYTAAGETLFRTAGAVSEGDEYISGDNQRYRVTAVDPQAMQAVATWEGQEDMPTVDWLTPTLAVPVSAMQGDRLIAMYVTHSDESYKPTDGVSSDENGGGIFDVAASLKESLEGLGITVAYDPTMHLPHDAGAYRRSRQTATRLLKQGPDAMLDIHRDGVPADEYVTEIDGQNATRVRLLVGRQNQNAEANRGFAKEIKAVADAQYPGLIKDIYIGKGSYNQDLMSQAVLLEFGTHTLSKERALASTEMIAQTLSTTLYGDVSGAAGGNASTEAAPVQDGAGSSIVWLIIAVVVVIAVFAFLSTGSGRGMLDRVRKSTREITGGLFRKKPE